MTITLQSLTLFILLTIPILFAAVQPFVWAVYTVLMYAAFVLVLWIAPQGGLPRPGNAFYLSLGPFFLVTLLLCLPLPDGVLALLSPTRFELLQESQALTGQPAHWRSLGYYPLHGLAWWGFLLGLALFFRVLQTTFSSQRSMRLTLWLLFGLAVLEACYGLLQALMPNMPVLWASHVKAYLGMARGTWINRNHFAGYMEMMIPLLLGFLLILMQILMLIFMLVLMLMLVLNLLTASVVITVSVAATAAGTTARAAAATRTSAA